MADAAATLGFKKFGTGQKDDQGRVMMSPDNVADFVKVLVKDPNLGECRVKGLPSRCICAANRAALRLSHDGYTNLSGGITPRTCDGGGVTPYMPNSPPCTHTPTGDTDYSYTFIIIL